MSSDVAVDVPARVCAGCGAPLSGRARRWCSVACRRGGEAQRRAERAAAAAAERLAERKAAVVEQVKRWYFLAVAAQMAQVSRSAAYVWMRDDADFGAAVEVARLVAADMREARVMAAAERGDAVELRAQVELARRIDAHESRRRTLARDAERRDAARPAVRERRNIDAQIEHLRRPRLAAVP